MNKYVIHIFLVSCFLNACSKIPPVEQNIHQVSMQAGELVVIIRDNEARPPDYNKGYNGIAVLQHSSSDKNLFRPKVSGFNLEHIFDGHKWDRMEPRHAPMTLRKVSPVSAELHQPPTPNWQLESRTIFTVVAPHFIDVKFQCTPSQAVFSLGYIGLYWASYITNVGGDPYIKFLGQRDMNDPVQWVDIGELNQSMGTVQSVQQQQRPTFHETYRGRLVPKVSAFGYTYPFYYGLYDEMVFIVMFDRTEGIEFRNGINPQFHQNGNAAWDWNYFIFNYEVDKIYEYNARIVYKPFVDRQDVIQEYERWSGTSVQCKPKEE